MPLYILLGEFADRGGYAHGLYRTGKAWLGRIPGGLSIATIVGGAGFGAVCGASVASSAVLGKICIPEMRRMGYDDSLAAGSVAACANLASMIPPSGLMIIYSMFTGQSLGKLFMAGFLPGLLITTVFCTMVWLRVTLRPSLAPPASERLSWRQRLGSLRYGWEIFVIAGVVLGGLYTGYFTVTEAGGVGALVAFLLALRTRTLDWPTLKGALLSAVRTTVMVLFVVVGIMIFTRFLTMSRVPLVVSAFLSDLPVHRVVILSLICAFYLFLGMFFDGISMMALTIPVLFPTILTLGYDPIWFGVLCVLLCEIGLITPPVGVNCFVVAGMVPDLSLEKIFRGALPFVFANLLCVATLISFPIIALYLPSLM